jgi:hypothetical protein
MQQALGEDRSLPTATVRRGIAYHDLMVHWIETVLDDLARLDGSDAQS